MYINHFFTYSACAQMIVAPFDNLVVSYNLEACRLLQRDQSSLEKASLSELFADSLPEFISFSNRLIEHGRAWCDRLLLATGDTSTRVEIQGTCSCVGEETLLHLTISPAEELNKRRQRSDGRRYFGSHQSLRNRDRDHFENLEQRISAHWPNNRAELQQLLENQPPLANDVSATGSFPSVERRSIPRIQDPLRAGEGKVLTTDELKNWERENLVRAISKTQGRIFGPDGAAELIGMKPTTLSAKLKRYGIDRRHFTPEAQTRRA